MRTLMTVVVCLALSGCVSTPNTKALITPVGAAGFHTFAPPSPDRMRRIDVRGLESVAATTEQQR